MLERRIALLFLKENIGVTFCEHFTLSVTRDMALPFLYLYLHTCTPEKNIPNIFDLLTRKGCQRTPLFVFGFVSSLVTDVPAANALLHRVRTLRLDALDLHIACTLDA